MPPGTSATGDVTGKPSRGVSAHGHRWYLVEAVAVAPRARVGMLGMETLLGATMHRCPLAPCTSSGRMMQNLARKMRTKIRRGL